MTKEKFAEAKAAALQDLEAAFEEMRSLQRQLKAQQEKIEWLMDMATYEYEEEEEEETA